MPNVCGVDLISEVDNAIRDRAAAYGLPLDLGFSFVWGESGYFSFISGDTYGGTGAVVYGPDGHRGMQTPNGIAWESYYHPGRFDCSHGLLQLNACGGQGTGMSWSQLTNPWINLDVGFQPIATAFRNTWTANIPQQTFLREIMRHSGHPGNVPDGNPVFEDAFANLWPKWLCTYQAFVPGDPVIIPPPVTPPNPPPPIPVDVPWPPIVVPPNPADDNLPWLIVGALGIAAIASLSGSTFKKIKIFEPGKVIIKKN